MRLINVNDFSLIDFSGSRELPAYAILSHTWGGNDTEVTYQDLKNLDEVVRKKAGFQKIEWTCLQAKEHDLEWAWVDTCCIDKGSSHELSEAINSMFRWYTNAAVCYVYLIDVPGNCPPLHDDDCVPSWLLFVEAFEESRWFTRGWTLQELIAPKHVLFFGQAWNFIAALPDVVKRVSGITGIQEDVLNEFKHAFALSDLSIARRLSWAAKRKTTRIEDEAYSLLGILNVNMPLLYGEGADAFVRLQKTIIANSTDQSVFAWNAPSGAIHARELLLAPSPSCFANAGKIRRRRGMVSESAFSISNNGLEITLPVLRRRIDSVNPPVWLGILDCRYEDNPEGVALALVMSQHPFSRPTGTGAMETYVSGCEQQLGNIRQYTRLLPISRAELIEADPRPLTITKDLRSRTYFQESSTYRPLWFPVRFTGDDPNFIPQPQDVYPGADASRTIRLHKTYPWGGITVNVAGNSVLIIFGTDVPTSTQTIYDVVKVHSLCPIEPHLRSLVSQRFRPAGAVARLPLDEERQVVAQLVLNGLTISVEPVEERSIGLSSPPASPTFLRAAPSIASSKTKDDYSFVYDGQSEVSRNTSIDEVPKLHWTYSCDNCQHLRAQERAEMERMRRDRRRQEADRQQLEKQQTRAKQFKRAKQLGAGLSIGTLLADIGEVGFL